MEKDLITRDYHKTVENLSDMVRENIKDIEIKMFNPALLAYIGDAVYELFVRTLLVSKGNSQAGETHKKAISYVKAKSQARLIEEIYESLTEEEKRIVKRGRNAKTGSMPKHAEIIEYKYATGFECLLGYLYLNNHITRLFEILQYVVEIMKEE
ncbi:MAG: Mini-ribonuclease 3 [Firmicutes bacterium]|nr:Mini-ribonuclease 3 [Bacillota bacterium]